MKEVRILEIENPNISLELPFDQTYAVDQLTDEQFINTLYFDQVKLNGQLIKNRYGDLSAKC